MTGVIIITEYIKQYIVVRKDVRIAFANVKKTARTYKTKTNTPLLLIHPGETISDILKERNITQKELAQRAGVSTVFLCNVINGKKDISKTLAKGLEYALDMALGRDDSLRERKRRERV